jgi:ubiquinone/menaquinone biosynthesis C-methylase UbiE
MKTRGEKNFIKLPSFAARLYDNLTSVKGVNSAFEEIADFIGNSVKQGRILDVGTGPGRLIYEINKKYPQIDLFGLDISPSMIELAKINLTGINVDLRVGNITKTDYADNTFTCVICSGSFYIWDNPIEGLNEIYRILESGMSAFLFESNRDYNKQELNNKLRLNLEDYGIIRKTLSKYFLKKQLRMTYSIAEIEEIIKQSIFSNSFEIVQTELGNLPIWLRIILRKP